MLNIKSVLIFLLAAYVMLNAQTFENFLNRITAAPDSLKPAITDSFLNAVPSFPYVERDTVVHFLFRGNATSVTIAGDANHWNPAAFPMRQIPGTDLWYYTSIFESDARLEYKFVLNEKYWILDSLNPHLIKGGFGPNSELFMPGYLPPPEIEYYPNIPHGELEDTVFYSTNLRNSRTIKIYLPPGYRSSTDSFGVILFHDGLDYLNLANARNVLDYLIWKKRIQPVIALFVPPVNRREEYAGNLKTAFAAFITEELMPWIDSRYRTCGNPSRRATLGASNGGNIALWLGLHHSDVFGKIAAQSSNVQVPIFAGFLNGPKLNLQFYLDVGRYDIPELIPLVQNLHQLLISRGYICQYRVFHEGHSWGNWRAHIDNALEQFFPGKALANLHPK